MENLEAIYSLLEEKGVEKLPLYKICEKMNCLGTLALFLGNRKSIFLKNVRKISVGGLAIKRFFLIIQKI